eukprot:m.170233 g.170233  ORF g.170233 m.170233 type:complete len:287 (-) comp14524_c0_seq4:287-1147(-)
MTEEMSLECCEAARPPATTFGISLIGGAVAGPVVDIVLFPLDTLKTRLQASEGFIKAGGFRGVYNGLLSAALGSAPSAATFFGTYEGAKTLLMPYVNNDTVVFAHMTAASLGEMTTAAVRMPFEMIKQRRQAGLCTSNTACIQDILRTKGVAGFWSGYFSLVMREVPFSLVQFPIYEKFKSVVKVYNNGEQIPSWQAALCGSGAGAIAAAITTPLDVAKTRILLDPKMSTNVFGVVSSIAQREGVKALFSGIVPRVMWISVGGFIFFGAYESTVAFVKQTALEQYD